MYLSYNETFEKCFPLKAGFKIKSKIPDFEDRLTIFDTLILCRFYRDLYPWEQLNEIIHLTTGLEVNIKTLKEKAATISTLVRHFNIREGLKPEDDQLPKKFHRKLKKTGDIITEQELDYMLKDYYSLRGWGEEGKPEA